MESTIKTNNVKVISSKKVEADGFSLDQIKQIRKELKDTPNWRGNGGIGGSASYVR